MDIIRVSCSSEVSSTQMNDVIRHSRTLEEKITDLEKKVADLTVELTLMKMAKPPIVELKERVENFELS